MIGIYKITSPSNKIYIGQSIDLDKRIKEYKKVYNCKSQTILYNSLKKHGIENHIFEIVCECEISELNDKERYYQDFFDCTGNKGMNCRLTKSSDKSGKLSLTTIEKLKGKRNLSLAQKEVFRKNLKIQKLNDLDWYKKSNKHKIGTKLSEEHINILRIVNKGKKHTKNTIEKMSIAKKNMSAETKKKIGDFNRGKKQSPENIEKRRLGLIGVKAKIIINTETKEEYKGLRTVSDKYGYKYNTLANMLNGTRKNNSIFVYK